MSTTKAELRAFFNQRLEEDKNVIGTYTDENGDLVVLVLDDKPSKLLAYDMYKEHVKFVKSAPFVAYQNPVGRFRPAPGGVSVGHYKVSAGTLSMAVRDKKDGSLSVLSNNHVFANIDNCNVGDDLLQPGTADGGVRLGDTIADLTRWVSLKNPGAHTVDCAIGKVKHEGDVSLNILNIGFCYGIVPAFVDQKIWKMGRTSGLTRGRVMAIDAKIQVNYGPAGDIVMEDCIISSIPSQPGDSGSSLLDFASNRCVGLLFAGNGYITVGCKATNVFRLLDIETIEPPFISRSFWLDISHWQSPISSFDDAKDDNFKANSVGLTPQSFSQMKAMGVRGVIIKVCEKGNIVDPEFENYYNMARQAGLLVTGYIFVRPGTSAQAHFDNFVNAVGNKKFDVPPVMDCEVADGQSSQMITSVYQSLGNLLVGWYGIEPFIYTGLSYWNTNVLRWSGWKDYPLHMAYWSDSAITPALPDDWKGVVGQPYIWQYDVSDNGQALGVGSQQVDTNLTFPSFETLLGNPVPTPSQKPTASTSASPSPSEPSNEPKVFEHYEGITLVSLNYRSGPGVQYSRIGTMKIGTRVEILENKSDASNNIWVRIGYNQWAAQLFNKQMFIRYVLEGE